MENMDNNVVDNEEVEQVKDKKKERMGLLWTAILLIVGEIIFCNGVSFIGDIIISIINKFLMSLSF